MTDPRSPADDAVHYLDRLGAVILDDVGDGPAPADFAILAAAVHTAVIRIGVGAFSELTGLIVGVGESMVAGATDWSPSLGGTLMAAIDDLRALIMRAGQFTAEDSEHLHHRASELAVFVRVKPGTAAAPPPPPSMPEIPTPVTTEISKSPPVGAAQETSQPMSRATDESAVVPISSLFFAEGPTVVSGGVPKSASGASDVLGAAIDALDEVGVRALAEPLASATRVMPVEQLIYRGRAALERAAAIREQIKTSGAASPAALDEMYDLIGLALND